MAVICLGNVAEGYLHVFVLFVVDEFVHVDCMKLRVDIDSSVYDVLIVVPFEILLAAVYEQLAEFKLNSSPGAPITILVVAAMDVYAAGTITKLAL